MRYSLLSYLITFTAAASAVAVSVDLVKREPKAQGSIDPDDYTIAPSAGTYEGSETSMKRLFKRVRLDSSCSPEQTTRINQAVSLGVDAAFAGALGAETGSDER